MQSGIEWQRNYMLIQNVNKNPIFRLANDIPRIIHLILFFAVLYWLLMYKLYNYYNSSINLFFQLYGATTALFLFSRLIIAIYYQDDHKRSFKKSAYPPVSFVIACKNEEHSISKSIRACLTSVYPGKMECIAVNDGSTDNTLLEMNKSQKKYGEQLLKIISFPQNKGKREAMSEGVLKAKGNIIIFIDSDSFVGKFSTKQIVSHFMIDPKIGAVSGNSTVENSNVNLLTKIQAARYGVSFDIFKVCESVFGNVTCCPGCFSAYRKSAILQVMETWRYHKFLGTRSTYGDDRSLTNYILRKWKVIYCRKAVATTIVPEKFRQFVLQQLRWKKSWIREGIVNAGSFMWKKHPVSAVSFYINLIIPIVGPFIVFKIIFFDFLIRGTSPLFFVNGVVSMSILFGLYYYLIRPNKYWVYVTVFTALYTFVLIWQMPYAIIKIRDTSWGTR